MDVVVDMTYSFLSSRLDLTSLVGRQSKTILAHRATTEWTQLMGIKVLHRQHLLRWWILKRRIGVNGAHSFGFPPLWDASWIEYIPRACRKCVKKPCQEPQFQRLAENNESGTGFFSCPGGLAVFSVV